jgi:hypothetical protein
MCKQVHGMKAKTISLAVTLCFVGAALCFADNAHMGAWKLNEAKSKLGRGASTNSTVVYEAVGDNVKVTVDGTDSTGKPTHNEWMGKFDGKDYPVIGDPNSDERSYTKIDDRTLGFNFKKDGKLTAGGRIEVSADAKTRTVTMRGIDSKGKKVMSIAVYDKQ